MPINFFILRNDFEHTNTQINPNQPTKTKISEQKTTKTTGIFCGHKNFKEGGNRWCFLHT